MNTPRYLQVQVTFPDRHTAENTAKKLVENRLAACAQILGEIQSVYVWKGASENNREILLLAKMKTELLDRFIDAVREDHPYDCPQIVALPIFAANEDYFAWMEEQMK